MDIRSNAELDELAAGIVGKPEDHTLLPAWVAACHGAVRLFASLDEEVCELPIRRVTQQGTSWYTEAFEGWWVALCHLYTPIYGRVVYESLLNGSIYNEEWEGDMLEFMDSIVWWESTHVALHAVLWVDSALDQFEELQHIFDTV